MSTFIKGEPQTNAPLASVNVRTNLDAVFEGDLEPLRVRAQSTPNMTVSVEDDNNRAYVIGNTPLNFAGGNSPSFTAPVNVNEKRIDILTLDSSGTLAIVQGTPTTGTPAPPAYPAEKLVLAEIYLRNGMSSVKNTDDAVNGYIFKTRTPLFNIGGGVPIGAVLINTSPTVPSGFELCDGAGGRPPADMLITSLEIDKAAGTTIGNMTYNGGLAAAFDGTTSQAYTACARGPDSVNNTRCGKNWGAGITKIITKAIVYGPHNLGFNPLDNSYTLTLQGSTDNFSSSIIDLGAITFTDTGNESLGRTLLPFVHITNFTAYQYHAIKFTDASGNEQYCAEIRFFETAPLIIKT